jgi:hypothetical protein
VLISRYMPCPECGAAVDGSSSEAHVCDPERLLDFRLFELRGDIAALESEIAAYLSSPEGRFEAWRAALGRP